MLHIKTHYFIELRDRIFVKEYEDFFFAKSMSKSLGSKYNKKLFDHGKQSAIDAIKTASKRAIQNMAEATGGLIVNKIAEKITKESRTSP